MNDKQIELAAKHLCKLRGLDPEGETFNTETGWRSVNWREVYPEVERHIQLNEAVQYGRIMG